MGTRVLLCTTSGRAAGVATATSLPSANASNHTAPEAPYSTASTLTTNNGSTFILPTCYTSSSRISIIPSSTSTAALPPSSPSSPSSAWTVDGTDPWDTWPEWSPQQQDVAAAACQLLTLTAELRRFTAAAASTTTGTITTTDQQSNHAKHHQPGAAPPHLLSPLPSQLLLRLLLLPSSPQQKGHGPAEESRGSSEESPTHGPAAATSLNSVPAAAAQLLPAMRPRDVVATLSALRTLTAEAPADGLPPASALRAAGEVLVQRSYELSYDDALEGLRVAAWLHADAGRGRQGRATALLAARRAEGDLGVGGGGGDACSDITAACNVTAATSADASGSGRGGGGGGGRGSGGGGGGGGGELSVGSHGGQGTGVGSGGGGGGGIHPVSAGGVATVGGDCAPLIFLSAADTGNEGTHGGLTGVVGGVDGVGGNRPSSGTSAGGSGSGASAGSHRREVAQLPPLLPRRSVVEALADRLVDLAAWQRWEGRAVAAVKAGAGATAAAGAAAASASPSFSAAAASTAASTAAGGGNRTAGPAVSVAGTAATGRRSTVAAAASSGSDSSGDVDRPLLDVVRLLAESGIHCPPRLTLAALRLVPRPGCLTPRLPASTSRQRKRPSVGAPSGPYSDLAAAPFPSQSHSQSQSQSHSPMGLTASDALVSSGGDAHGGSGGGGRDLIAGDGPPGAALGTSNTLRMAADYDGCPLPSLQAVRQLLQAGVMTEMELRLLLVLASRALTAQPCLSGPAAEELQGGLGHAARRAAGRQGAGAGSESSVTEQSKEPLGVFGNGGAACGVEGGEGSVADAASLGSFLRCQLAEAVVRRNSHAPLAALLPELQMVRIAEPLLWAPPSPEPAVGVATEGAATEGASVSASASAEAALLGAVAAGWRAARLALHTLRQAAERDYSVAVASAGDDDSAGVGVSDGETATAAAAAAARRCSVSSYTSYWKAVVFSQQELCKALVTVASLAPVAEAGGIGACRGGAAATSEQPVGVEVAIGEAVSEARMEAEAAAEAAVATLSTLLAHAAPAVAAGEVNPRAACDVAAAVLTAQRSYTAFVHSARAGSGAGHGVPAGDGEKGGGSGLGRALAALAEDVVRQLLLPLSDADLLRLLLKDPLLLGHGGASPGAVLDAGMGPQRVDVPSRHMNSSVVTRGSGSAVPAAKTAATARPDGASAGGGRSGCEDGDADAELRAGFAAGKAAAGDAVASYGSGYDDAVWRTPGLTSWAALWSPSLSSSSSSSSSSTSLATGLRRRRGRGDLDPAQRALNRRLVGMLQDGSLSSSQLLSLLQLSSRHSGVMALPTQAALQLALSDRLAALTPAQLTEALHLLPGARLCLPPLVHRAARRVLQLYGQETTADAAGGAAVPEGPVPAVAVDSGAAATRVAAVRCGADNAAAGGREGGADAAAVVTTRADFSERLEMVLRGKDSDNGGSGGDDDSGGGVLQHRDISSLKGAGVCTATQDPTTALPTDMSAAAAGAGTPPTADPASPAPGPPSTASGHSSTASNHGTTIAAAVAAAAGTTPGSLTGGSGVESAGGPSARKDGRVSLRMLANLLRCFEGMPAAAEPDAALVRQVVQTAVAVAMREGVADAVAAAALAAAPPEASEPWSGPVPVSVTVSAVSAADNYPSQVRDGSSSGGGGGGSVSEGAGAAKASVRATGGPEVLLSGGAAAGEDDCTAASRTVGVARGPQGGSEGAAGGDLAAARQTVRLVRWLAGRVQEVCDRLRPAQRNAVLAQLAPLQALVARPGDDRDQMQSFFVGVLEAFPARGPRRSASGLRPRDPAPEPPALPHLQLLVAHLPHLGSSSGLSWLVTRLLEAHEPYLSGRLRDPGLPPWRLADGLLRAAEQSVKTVRLEVLEGLQERVLLLPSDQLMTLAARSSLLHLLPPHTLAAMVNRLRTHYSQPRNEVESEGAGGLPAPPRTHVARQRHDAATKADADDTQDDVLRRYGRDDDGGSGAGGAADELPPASVALSGLVDAISRRMLSPEFHWAVISTSTSYHTAPSTYASGFASSSDSGPATSVPSTSTASTSSDPDADARALAPAPTQRQFATTPPPLLSLGVSYALAEALATEGAAEVPLTRVARDLAARVTCALAEQAMSAPPVRPSAAMAAAAFPDAAASKRESARASASASAAPQASKQNAWVEEMERQAAADEAAERAEIDGEPEYGRVRGAGAGAGAASSLRLPDDESHLLRLLRVAAEQHQRQQNQGALLQKLLPLVLSRKPRTPATRSRGGEGGGSGSGGGGGGGDAPGARLDLLLRVTRALLPQPRLTEPAEYGAVKSYMRRHSAGAASAATASAGEPSTIISVVDTDDVVARDMAPVAVSSQRLQLQLLLEDVQERLAALVEGDEQPLGGAYGEGIVGGVRPALVTTWSDAAAVKGEAAAEHSVHPGVGAAAALEAAAAEAEAEAAALGFPSGSMGPGAAQGPMSTAAAAPTLDLRNLGPTPYIAEFAPHGTHLRPGGQPSEMSRAVQRSLLAAVQHRLAALMAAPHPQVLALLAPPPPPKRLPLAAAAAEAVEAGGGGQPQLPPFPDLLTAGLGRRPQPSGGGGVAGLQRGRGHDDDRLYEMIRQVLDELVLELSWEVKSGALAPAPAAGSVGDGSGGGGAGSTRRQQLLGDSVFLLRAVAGSPVDERTIRSTPARPSSTSASVPGLRADGDGFGPRGDPDRGSAFSFGQEEHPLNWQGLKTRSPGPGHVGGPAGPSKSPADGPAAAWAESRLHRRRLTRLLWELLLPPLFAASEAGELAPATQLQVLEALAVRQAPRLEREGTLVERLLEGLAAWLLRQVGEHEGRRPWAAHQLEGQPRAGSEVADGRGREAAMEGAGRPPAEPAGQDAANATAPSAPTSPAPLAAVEMYLRSKAALQVLGFSEHPLLLRLQTTFARRVDSLRLQQLIEQMGPLGREKGRTAAAARALAAMAAASGDADAAAVAAADAAAAEAEARVAAVTGEVLEILRRSSLEVKLRCFVAVAAAGSADGTFVEALSDMIMYDSQVLSPKGFSEALWALALAASAAGAADAVRGPNAAELMRAAAARLKVYAGLSGSMEALTLQARALVAAVRLAVAGCPALDRALVPALRRHLLGHLRSPACDEEQLAALLWELERGLTMRPARRASGGDVGGGGGGGGGDGDGGARDAQGDAADSHSGSGWGVASRAVVAVAAAATADREGSRQQRLELPLLDAAADVLIRITGAHSASFQGARVEVGGAAAADTTLTGVDVAVGLGVGAGASDVVLSGCSDEVQSTGGRKVLTHRDVERRLELLAAFHRLGYSSGAGGWRWQALLTAAQAAVRQRLHFDLEQLQRGLGDSALAAGQGDEEAEVEAEDEGSMAFWVRSVGVLGAADGLPLDVLQVASEVVEGVLRSEAEQTVALGEMEEEERVD